MDIVNDVSFRATTCHKRWMGDAHQSGLVSVVVPTYNRADMLVDAMDSVWAQTWRPIELIVVDDGSTDGTADSVARWSSEHTEDLGFNLRFFRQENKGAPTARNLGLIESTGEFIQFLDSDDLLHPDKLASQVGALKAKPELDFVWSPTAFFDKKPDYSAKPYCGLPRDRLLEGRLNSPLWAVMSGLYRRSACKTLGPWDEDLLRYQDWVYSIRFCALNPAVEFVPGTLSLARRHRHGRIDDLSKSAAGIKPGIMAADRALEAMRILGADTRHTESAIARIYFGFAKNALQWDDDEHWNAALRKACDCRTGWKLRCNLLAVRWMRRILGKKLLKRVFARKFGGFDNVGQQS